MGKRGGNLGSGARRNRGVSGEGEEDLWKSDNEYQRDVKGCKTRSAFSITSQQRRLSSLEAWQAREEATRF